MRKMQKILFFVGGILGAVIAEAQWTPTDFKENIWILCQTSNGNLLAANDIYPDLGTIFISKDEGNSWSETTATPYGYTAFLVTDDAVYMGGTDRTVAISHDNGDNWVTSTFWHLFPDADPSEPIYAIEAHNDRIYVSLLAYGIVYSDDKGETWHLTDRDSLLDPNNPDNGGQWTYDLQSFNGKLYNIGAFGIWEYNEEEDQWSHINGDWYSYKALVVDDLMYIVYNAPGLPYGIRYTRDFVDWEIMPIPEEASTSVGFLQEHQGALFMGHVEETVYYTLDQGQNWIPYKEGFPYFSPIPELYFYGVPMNFVFLEDSMLVGVFSGFEDVAGVYRAPIPTLLNIEEMTNFTNAIVYPNPTSDWITLKSENTNTLPTQLSIYDVLGRKVKELKYAQQRTQMIDVSDLAAGVYFLRVQDDDRIQSIKFIKK